MVVGRCIGEGWRRNLNPRCGCRRRPGRRGVEMAMAGLSAPRASRSGRRRSSSRSMTSNLGRCMASDPIQRCVLFSFLGYYAFLFLFFDVEEKKDAN